jgi:hypothetical protein
MFKNRVLLYSFLAELCIIIFLVYVPGLNTGVMFTGIIPEFAVTGLWMLPIIIINEEVRKAIIRKWPKGRYG